MTVAAIPFPEDFPSNVIASLGAPVRYFTIRKLNTIGSLVLFLLLLGGGAAAALYGLLTASSAYWRHGIAVLPGKLTAPLFIAAALFVLAVLAGIAAYKNWNRGILLSEKGFAFRSRKGVHEWRWEDIASIRLRITRNYIVGIYSGTSHEYALTNRQNERLVINDAFTKVDDLAEAIEQNTFALLYGPAAEQYNQGKPLAFGPVVISRIGLHFGKKTIRWEQVNEVTLQRGELKVSQKEGGWRSGASVPASAIPNLRVLLSLIDQVVGLKAI